MSGIATLSINYDKYYAGNKQELDKRFINDLFWLTFYHQHLAQEYSGLATLTSQRDGQGILLRTHRGLFRHNFKDDLEGFQGPLGIGHISDSFRQPFFVKSAFPDFVICFSGHLINKEEIAQELQKDGHGFERDDDVSLISCLIVKTGWQNDLSPDENFIRGINYMANCIQGSYALAILTLDKIYIARGPDGHELLTAGVKPGAIAICSESTGFYNQGFKPAGDIKAGEIIALKNGRAASLGFVRTKNKIVTQPCSFNKVYTDYPVCITMGITAAEVRRHLGANLAKRDIKNDFFPDVVVPVPDSGRFHAIGYHQEYVRQTQVGETSSNKIPFYDEILTKYPYAGRSYTPANEEARRIEALKKIIPLIENKYKDKVIVVCDDSIVRGTQSKNDLVPKVKATGVAEVHFRISNPKLVNTCDWTKSNKKKDQLAAFDITTGQIKTEEEIAQMLGINSCYFNTCQDVAEAIGIPLEKLCVDCDIVKGN